MDRGLFDELLLSRWNCVSAAASQSLAIDYGDRYEIRLPVAKVDPNALEVEATDGRTFTEASDERYRGGPEKPFTRTDLHEKFTDCASLVLPPDRIRRALELIESVETLQSIRELTQAMEA